MESHFVQEDAVGNNVKGIIEVQVDNIKSLSLIHPAGHLDTGDQVGKAGPAFQKPLLSGPYPLLVLCLLCDGTQDDLLHGFPGTKVRLTGSLDPPSNISCK